MKYQLVERTRDLLSFENALKPLNVFNIRRKVGKKVLGKVTLSNIRTETYETDVIDPRGPECADCTTVDEPISVRLIVSGSPAAAVRLKQMVRNVCAAYIENEEGLTKGQLPVNSVDIHSDSDITISHT